MVKKNTLKTPLKARKIKIAQIYVHYLLLDR